MQRFEREAWAPANFDHPNIAAIFSIDEGAVAMELDEG